MILRTHGRRLEDEHEPSGTKFCCQQQKSAALSLASIRTRSYCLYWWWVSERGDWWRRPPPTANKTQHRSIEDRSSEARRSIHLLATWILFLFHYTQHHTTLHFLFTSSTPILFNLKNRIQSNSSQIKSNQTKPNQTKPNQINSNNEIETKTKTECYDHWMQSAAMSAPQVWKIVHGEVFHRLKTTTS